MRGNERIATQITIERIVIQIAVQVSPCVLANPSDCVSLKNHHLLPLRMMIEFSFSFVDVSKMATYNENIANRGIIVDEFWTRGSSLRSTRVNTHDRHLTQQTKGSVDSRLMINTHDQQTNGSV